MQCFAESYTVPRNLPLGFAWPGTARQPDLRTRKRCYWSEPWRELERVSDVVVGALAQRTEIDYRRCALRRLIFPFYFHFDAESSSERRQRLFNSSGTEPSTLHGMLISLASGRRVSVQLLVPSINTSQRHHAGCM